MALGDDGNADDTTGTAGSPAAVDASVLDGIANLIDEVSQNIDQAITRTKSWSDESYGQVANSGDRYVTGGVNWDGYDLPTLVSMVADPASPAQVQTVAGLWRANGASITQGAENLSQSLTTLMNYWQGTAAQQVSASVADTANWITTVGETSGTMADLVEDASGALQSAQNTMPGTPNSSFWLAYNTAADGASVGSAGGPFGAAAGAMVGGLTSVFGASADDGSMKQQAVQTMQRYEQAAVTIDTKTPQFTPPPTWSADGIGTTGGVGSDTALLLSDTGVAGGAGLSAVGTDLSTVPSFADSPTGRWNGLTGGASGVGPLGGTGADGGGLLAGGAGLFGDGALGGGLFGTGLFGGGAFGGGSNGRDGSDAEAGARAMVGGVGGIGSGVGGVGSSGVGSSGVGSGGVGSGVGGVGSGISGVGSGASTGAAVAAAGRDDPSGAAGGADAAGASVLEDADGRGLAGGMPMGAGMGGLGTRGGGDSEYRRRIPYENDDPLFATGMKTVPPVIGLSGDREADR